MLILGQVICLYWAQDVNMAAVACDFKSSNTDVYPSMMVVGLKVRHTLS